MKNLRFRIGLLFLFLSFSCFASKDALVVDKYMSALRENDFMLAASLVDKSELDAFKLLFVNIGQMAADKGKYAEFSSGPFRQFKTIEQLKDVDSKEFFSTFLRNNFTQNQQSMHMINGAEYTYIGNVQESGTKALGVIKVTMYSGEEPIEMTDIIPLVIRDSEYYIGVKSSMKLMSIAFKRRIERM